MSKLYIFDLDGTLAESKQPISKDMVEELSELPNIISGDSVAIISGCSMEQFKTQVIPKFGMLRGFSDLFYLMPTSGAACWVDGGYDAGWVNLWNSDLLLREKAKIYDCFTRAVKRYNAQLANQPGSVFCSYKRLTIDDQGYGEIAEDRGSQITFSMLGQSAPLDKKLAWDPDMVKRKNLVSLMEAFLPEFEIRIGGTTSIDVTKKGIDKAFGVLRIIEYLGIDKSDVVFIGDALFDGGNDSAVKKTGVRCIETSGVQETKIIIQSLREK